MIRKLACKELVPGTCRHLPFLFKGADKRKLACKELVPGTCRHLPLLSKGADIRKLACKEFVTGTCRHLPFLSKGADIRKLACKELVRLFPKSSFHALVYPPVSGAQNLYRKTLFSFRFVLESVSHQFSGQAPHQSYIHLASSKSF